MLRSLVFLLVLWISTGTGRAAPLIAAHRGLVTPDTTENSIEAVRAAVDAGIDVVEVDLRTTADEVIVLVHDATLDRVTTGRGRVAQLTLAEIKTLSLKAGKGRIATFEEALKEIRGAPTRLLLDIKTPGGIDPQQILALAEAHGARNRLIIGVRTATDVRVYRSLDPSLTIIGFIPSQADAQAFINAGADIIRLWARWLAQPAAGCVDGASPSCIVQKLKARGPRIWAADDAPSTNEPAKACLHWLAGLELDGILTNQPLLARAAASAGTQPTPLPGARRCGW